MKTDDFKHFPYYIIAAVKSITYSKFKYRIKAIKRNYDRINLILGTGPSLKEDLNMLPLNDLNIDYFCVNDFMLSNDFERIKPQYYLLLDPLYWRDSISSDGKERRKSVIEALNKKTKWDLTLFLPSSANIKYFNSIVTNSYISIKLYNHVGIPFVNSHLYYKLMDTQLFAPNGDNVIIHAIYLSLNLGYKTSCMLGVDASWHELLILDQKNNTLKIKMTHFDKIDDANQLFQDDLKTKQANMTWIMNFLNKTFSSFQLIADYASYRNHKVYNCSKFSWIDSFERKRASDIKKIHNVL